MAHHTLGPMPLTYQPTPPMVIMPPHTAFPLLHNSHALTHSTTHNSYTLCINTPAHDPTCLTHAITRQLECQHLSHGQLHVGPSGTLVIFLYFSRDAARSQERELQPFQSGPFPGRPHPTSPSIHLSSRTERSPRGRRLRMRLRRRQWRGDSQTVLDRGVCG